MSGSTGAGDGTLSQILFSIANCEGFYLQNLAGVDDLKTFSPRVKNSVDGAYPLTMGVYEYSTFKPYTIAGAPIGGTGPIKVYCHYFKRMWLVGGRNDDMENVIVPQLELIVDYYDAMLSAHQTAQEPKWAANYKILPNIVIVPTIRNDHAYQNKTGQTFVTGSVEPTWNTGSGSTTADGTGIWTEIRAPWGAVASSIKATKAEVFSIVTEEQQEIMGIAYSVEATAFPTVTVGA
jgi:hypothetical protein